MIDSPYSSLIAVALGAMFGFISAATIFLYQRAQQRSELNLAHSNTEDIYNKISQLTEELHELRVQNAQQRKQRRKINRTRESMSLTFDNSEIDTLSIAGTDVGTDEFYDCFDNDDGTDDNDNGESECLSSITQQLTYIDDKSEQGDEGKEVYNILLKLRNLHPTNVDVIWRFARSCFNYSSLHATENEQKKAIIEQGINACKPILDVKNADLHKWYAILIGSIGDFLPASEKIKNGFIFKDHVKLALDIRPEDPTLYHLLGRFQYEISGLSWFERKIASTFFSELPSNTYEDAISSFKLAEQFAKEPHLENRLFLSKAHIALCQYDEALHWLKLISEENVTSSEDERIKSEATELFDKYASYNSSDK